MKGLGSATSLVAHELKTPLSVIAGFAELLVTRDDARTRLEAAGQIRRAAGRLSRMIDDLIATSSLDSGTLPVDAEPVELRAALDETVRHLEAGGEICVISTAGVAGEVIDADPEHVRQILTNAVVLACAGGAPVRGSSVTEGGFAVLTLAPAAAPGASGPAGEFAASVAQRLSELAGGSLSFAGDALTVRLPLARRDAA